MIGGFVSKLLFSIYNYSIRTSDGKFFIIWDTFVSITSDLDVDVPQKPIEDGRFSTNSKIRKPQTLTIQAMKSAPFVIYKDIQKLNSAVKSPLLFTISTRYGVYKNYCLQSFSYTLDTARISRLDATMVFTEVIIVTPEYQNLSPSDLKNAQNSSSVSTGKKPLKDASKGSVAFQLFKKVSKTS